MYIAGYLFLVLSFLTGIIFIILILFKYKKDPSWLHKLIFAFVGFSCLILSICFLEKDFSLVYVYNYTDKSLPWYYALSAFWAGQEGSLLLWLFFICLSVHTWTKTQNFKSLNNEIIHLFWLFVLPLEVFFLALLLTTINPFLRQIPAPSDGLGLNPLLQHPAMVFHPPLLFLGYSGFTVAYSFVLANWLKNDSFEWISKVRGWMLLFWSFLTAGILLGCWWSYMELGWGGYWAWDPVENSSLIPWLLCTSFLHSLLLTRKREALFKTSIILVSFIPVSCILGTFLTRSGILESLHTFSESQVGIPIFVFMIFLIVLTLLAFFSRSQQDLPSGSLPSLFSKDGLVVVSNWLFIFLMFAILLGTLWPALSTIFSEHKHAVGTDFFNKTCLPLFSLIIFLLMLCFSLTKGIGRWWLLTFVVITFILWLSGIKKTLVLFSMSSAISSIVTAIYLLIKYSVWSQKNWMGLGIHISVALMVIGIAMSSGYKHTKEALLKPGQKISIENFVLEFKNYDTEFTKNSFVFRAKLLIKKGNRILKELAPYKKMFKNGNSFSSVEVLPMWFNELYVVILSFDPRGSVNLQVSLHPFVNWMWCGGILLCLVSLISGIKVHFENDNRN